MIRMLMPIPNRVDVAFSGGVDSVSIAHFLAQGKRNIRLLHFNHGNSYSEKMENFCREFAQSLGVEILVGNLSGEKERGQSKEDFWRRQRYNWLRSVSDLFITGHHLNDAAETWIWSSLHGQSKLIPAQGNKLIRPFLVTEKQEFVDYASRRMLDFYEDPSNSDTAYMRNYIRAHIFDHATHVNPGLLKVIRKKYEEEYGR